MFKIGQLVKWQAKKITFAQKCNPVFFAFFRVFLLEREKQLDALFDGHAFNHSAGCQVDGCSNVPGMGKSGVEQGQKKE